MSCLLEQLFLPIWLLKKAEIIKHTNVNMMNSLETNDESQASNLRICNSVVWFNISS